APERLAAALGLTFKDLDLLRLALTHRSVIHDWSAAMPDLPPPSPDRQSNERLEFLGDAVLGYVVADYLYHRYPDSPEGLLTAKRVSLVRAERLVRWAREINLADYLYLGQGEKVTENARDRMLAGAFEALVGALTLDRGLREARRFLRGFIARDEAEMLAELSEANPKGRLQELLQEKYRTPPVYRILNEEGPAHARIFTAEVMINGEALGIGTGASKRDAEQAAATAALQAPPAAPSPVSPDRPSTRRRPRKST
ncbi:MAG: ribonuclease III, partial [Thermomicrobiales bacterium]|nr:ribonuclease III [Thermomicrobiales bacterium]